MRTFHRISLALGVGVSAITFASLASAQNTGATQPQTTTDATTDTTASTTTTTGAPVQTSTTTTTSAQLGPDYSTGGPPPAAPMATSPTPTPTPAPEATETTEHRFLNRPLFVTGLVGFGATYGTSIIVGAESDRGGDHNYLYYPVVGPWMDLANRDCTLSSCGNETGARTLLIADGVVQGLGALAIVSSFFIPERVTKKWYLIGNDKLTIAPSNVGRSGYGLGAHGAF